MSSLPASYFKRTAGTCKVNDSFILKTPNERTTEIKDVGQSYRERRPYANSPVPKTGSLFLVPMMERSEEMEKDDLVKAINTRLDSPKQVRHSIRDVAEENCTQIIVTAECPLPVGEFM